MRKFATLNLLIGNEQNWLEKEEEEGKIKDAEV